MGVDSQFRLHRTRSTVVPGLGALRNGKEASGAGKVHGVNCIAAAVSTSPRSSKLIRPATCSRPSLDRWLLDVVVLRPTAEVQRKCPKPRREVRQGHHDRTEVPLRILLRLLPLPSLRRDSPIHGRGHNQERNRSSPTQGRRCGRCGGTIVRRNGPGEPLPNGPTTVTVSGAGLAATAGADNRERVCLLCRGDSRRRYHSLHPVEHISGDSKGL